MKKYFLIAVCLICTVWSAASASVVSSVKDILDILDALNSPDSSICPDGGSPGKDCAQCKAGYITAIPFEEAANSVYRSSTNTALLASSGVAKTFSDAKDDLKEAIKEAVCCPLKNVVSMGDINYYCNENKVVRVSGNIGFCCGNKEEVIDNACCENDKIVTVDGKKVCASEVCLVGSVYCDEETVKCG